MEESKAELFAAAESLNSGVIHLLRAVRAVDGESGVTPARLSALSVLVYGGPRTLGRLAKAEDVSSPTMTRIVDGLVSLGLAAKEPHPDSGRLVRITATEYGRQLMEAARARRVAVLVDSLRALRPQQQRELLAAAPLLEQLAEIVRLERRRKLMDAPDQRPGTDLD